MSLTWPHLLPVLRAVYQPPPDDPIWLWAERTLRLSASQNREHAGQPWRIDRVPHTRLIFDFFRDPYARELHIMKSSAAAFSTAILVAICWHVRYQPCRVLYCLNNISEMRKVSKAILQPFLRQTFGEDVVDDRDQATLFFQFSNGSIIEMGSPTEGFFSNKQASIIVLDEYDLYPDELEGGYGDPLGTARGRFKASTGFAKLITLTAPQRAFDEARAELTQPGTKQHRAYLSGDRREFRIKCPACEMEFAPVRAHLEFDSLRLPPDPQAELALPPSDGSPPPEPVQRPYDMDRVRAEAALRCPTCAHLIREGLGPRDKAALVKAGRWLPTFRDNPPTRWSACYNDLCAIIGDSALGTLAAELIDSRAKSRHDFIQVCRARFAEPEAEEDAIDLSVDHVRRHCGAYQRGTCPIVPAFIALVSDVQKGPSDQHPLLFKWARVAFAADGTAYVIDYDSTISPTELRHRYERPIPYSGPPLPPPPAPPPPAAGAPPVPPTPKPGPFPPAGPVQFYCSRAVIDAGYRAGADLETEESLEHHVYPLCVAWGYRPDGVWQQTSSGWRYTGTWHLMPFKGRSREQLQGQAVDTTWATAAHPHHGQVEIPLFFFNDPWFKSELYHGILAADPLSKDDPRLSRYPRIHFPLPEDQLDEQFLSELTSEREVITTRKIHGRTRVERLWRVQSKRKNDFGDVVKMARVLLAFMTR